MRFYTRSTLSIEDTYRQRPNEDYFNTLKDNCSLEMYVLIYPIASCAEIPFESYDEASRKVDESEARNLDSFVSVSGRAAIFGCLGCRRKLHLLETSAEIMNDSITTWGERPCFSSESDTDDYVHSLLVQQIT
jgi:hypothetical protein